MSSLKRKPRAPGGLDSLLQKYYPRRAKLQGVEGKAVVALRIMPSGRVRRLRTVREWPDGFGFGKACMQMLRRAPPFVPPLDRSGRPVAVDIAKFNCSFEINY
jgi:TonB family protein